MKVDRQEFDRAKSDLPELPRLKCRLHNLCTDRTRNMLQICRVTVAYGCLEMVTAACGSLRLPNLAIMYLVAHYTRESAL